MQPSVNSNTPLSRTAGLVFLIAGIILTIAPLFVDAGVLRTLVEVFVFVTLALMWNLLCGYGGMPSIGQHAFIGLSAYLLFTLANKWGVQPFLAWVIAIAICGALAWPLTHLLFRLRDGYFAIGTWVVADTLRLIAANTSYVGGGSGMTLTAFRSISFSVRSLSIYWLALALVFASLIGCYLLLKSRFGLALTAIRDNERCASGIGINVKRVKTIIFVLTSMGFSAAGGIYYMNALRVSPDSAFGIHWSAILIFMVVVGGIGSLEGPLIGAFLYLILLNYFSDSGTMYLIGLGVVAISVTLLFRSGIWGAIVGKFNIHIFPTSRHVSHLPRGQ